jgi:hypothetical protein
MQLPTREMQEEWPASYRAAATLTGGRGTW